MELQTKPSTDYLVNDVPAFWPASNPDAAHPQISNRLSKHLEAVSISTAPKIIRNRGSMVSRKGN